MLGSEMRERRFWEEEKRKCRLCGWEEDVGTCGRGCMREEGGDGKMRIVELLDEGGGGEGWMKKLEKERETGRMGVGKGGGDGRTEDECEREGEEK